MGIEREVWKGNDKVGRADIINLNTGHIWELKTSSSYASAKTQVQKYVGGRIKDVDNTLSKGPAGAFCGGFIIDCMGISNLVFYYTPSPGVALYKVFELKGKRQAAYEYVPQTNTLLDYRLQPAPAFSPNYGTYNFAIPDSGGGAGGAINAGFVVGCCLVMYAAGALALKEQ